MRRIAASIVVALVCLVVSGVFGLKSGAPESTCSNMKPEHGANETNENFNYVIQILPSRIKAGGTAEVRISGGDFRGFMLQARVGDIPVGKFIIKDEFKNVMHHLDCSEESKNTVTHSEPSDKSSVSVIWSAPPKLKETVTFYATIVKRWNKFWVKRPSQPLVVS